MQEFLMDYGLWLLVGLLVIIGLVFLLTGRKGSAALLNAERDEPETTEAMVVQPSAPSAPVVPLAPAVSAPEQVAPSVKVEPEAPEPAPLAPTTAPVAITKSATEPAITPSPTPVVESVTATEGDDLSKIKGLGPKLRSLLKELGITHYAQIAAWTDADIANIDAKLGTFKGRPTRDKWVDQARYLAAGDVAGFEANYGKL